MTDATAGADWRFRCTTCSSLVSTRPGGVCPECEARLPVPRPRRWQDGLSPLARTLALKTEPVVQRLAGWGRASPWTFVVFWGALLTGQGPFQLDVVGFLFWAFLFDRLFSPRPEEPPPLRTQRLPAPADMALPEGAGPRPRVTRYFRHDVELRRSWWSLTRIRERRGVTVHLDLRLQQMQGEPLTFDLRVRGPDGALLPSGLPAYRGPEGEARSRHRTPPLRHDDARFPDLWIFLPLRALSLPQGLALAALECEARLHTPRGPVLTHHLPVDFVPVPEDLWAEHPDALPRAEGLLIGEVAEDAPAACQVCGDLDDEVRTGCPTCGARHHQECWDYLGGCARFGCSEGPTRTT